MKLSQQILITRNQIRIGFSYLPLSSSLWKRLNSPQHISHKKQTLEILAMPFK